MKKPEELENRAANPHDPQGTEDVLADIAKMKGKDSQAQQQGVHPTSDLEARLAAGREVPIPPVVQLHCRHCYGEGVQAACNAIKNWKPE